MVYSSLKLADSPGASWKVCLAPNRLDPATPTTLFWDGRNETFALMPGGMYVVHLSVVKEGTGEEETRTAPVVVATRFD